MLKKPSVIDLLWVSTQLFLLYLLVTVTSGPKLGWLAHWRFACLPLCAAGLGIAAVAALNLGSALTPYATPRPDGHLQTSGIYRFLRHPIYFGGWIWGAGVVARHDTIFSLLCLIALGVVFVAKARYEEKLLSRRYPEYLDYAARTPACTPLPR